MTSLYKQSFKSGRLLGVQVHPAPLRPKPLTFQVSSALGSPKKKQHFPKDSALLRWIQNSIKRSRIGRHRPLAVLLLRLRAWIMTSEICRQGRAYMSSFKTNLNRKLQRQPAPLIACNPAQTNRHPKPDKAPLAVHFRRALRMNLPFNCKQYRHSLSVMANSTKKYHKP